MQVELSYSLSGTYVPLGHGYALYRALSLALPAVHGAEWLGIHSINGAPAGNGLLMLNGQSALKARLPLEPAGDLLPITGRRITLTPERGVHVLRVGRAEVSELRPAGRLRAQLGTITTAVLRVHASR